MKILFCLFGIASLVLTGCKTNGIVVKTKSYNQLIGKTYDELIIEKGVPSGETMLQSGGRIVQYNDTRSETSGGGSVSMPTTAYVGGMWVQSTQQQHYRAQTETLTCNIIFVISPQNIVEKWKSQGGSCKEEEIPNPNKGKEIQYF